MFGARAERGTIPAEGYGGMGESELQPTPPRIMVVDDDERLLLLLRLVLQDEGLIPWTFSGGQAALDALASTAPAAIVLDLEMPGMSGREFYRRLRADGHVMPVLVLSGLDARSAQRELGAEAFMDKPFSSTELARTVVDLARQVPTATSAASLRGNGSVSTNRVPPPPAG
jgi:DNA-binding response OmpR family regulator